ncbi:MAG: hypothetical protein CSA58_09030 [Micrococcales bacterium]|nr:MAG: hypothetical protein CSB46_06880 [Micrococcales bacterium]PIE26528.1 MAG: hypothetical protein CSA58_09030 [Micrococcales bacterium]
MEAKERQRIRRIIGSDPVTAPTPVVSRLRGTPFAGVRRGTIPDDVLDSMDLVLRVAALAIRYGAGMRDVEAMTLATAAALGLADDYLEYDLTFSSAMVAYAPPGLDPVVRVLVVRSPARDYSRLAALHEYVTELAAGHAGHSDARAKLAAVESARKPYRRSLVRVAWAMMTSLIVLRLGGDAVAVATSFGATIVIDWIGHHLYRRGAPWPLVTLAGAVLAAFIAIVVGATTVSGLGHLDPDVARRTSLVVAGGVMMLLPGLQLVSVIEDGLWDYPLSAGARLFQALLGTSAIIAGVGAVFAAAPAVGADVAPLTDPLRGELSAHWWTYLLIVFAATLAAAVGNRVPPRMVMITGLAGTAGVAVLMLSQGFGLSAQIGTFLGAFVVGAVGRAWAARYHTAAMAVVVPGITMLLPGLAVVEALRQLSGGNPVDGLIHLLGAATTAGAIALGSVMGGMLASSLEQGTVRLRRGVWPARDPEHVGQQVS